jgi:hypothetical protein
MKSRRLVEIVVVIVLLLVFGCNNPTDAYISLDEEAIQDYISNDHDFAGYFAFDDYYGEEDTVPPGIRLRTITGPSIWYREPQNINREISINIVNDSAFVSLWHSVEGVFHILEIDTSASPDTLIDHQKGLQDYSSNYAIFKRYPGVSAYRGWRLESLTGVNVNADSEWVAIDSVRINCQSYENTLFTTPFVFFQREELLTFGKEEAVTLTIYSNDNIYAYLHAHSLGHWRRWILEEIESGVWQGYWITPLIPVPRIKVIAFDVLTKNTIDEEDSWYESNIWIFPYRVE